MTQFVMNSKLEFEILEEKNRVQSQLNYVAMMNHEFRTPLATSITFLESLLM